MADLAGIIVEVVGLTARDRRQLEETGALAIIERERAPKFVAAQIAYMNGDRDEGDRLLDELKAGGRELARLGCETKNRT